MDVSVSIFNKIFCTDVLKTLFVCVLVITIHVFVLFGIGHCFLVLTAYVIGLCTFHLLLERVDGIDEVLSLIGNSVLQRYWSASDFSENSESNVGKKLLVPADVDGALDQLLSRILDHYVSHWYTNISSDHSFQYEIRVILQNAISVCYQRLSQVNIENFVFKKAVPLCLNHISCYDDIERNNDVSHLHIAVHSRTAEILYLQNTSKCLLKFILPDSGLRCKSSAILLREIICKSLFLTLSDTICNPNVLNWLLLRYLNGDYNLLPTETDTDVEKVELLENFVSALKIKPSFSPLRPDLASILRDQDLSDAFMRYLKSVNNDHILQFFIDIENFNGRVLKPNLEADEIDNLYRDAWDLYSVYFSNHSPNCITFKKDLAPSLRKVLSKDVLKLRTNSTLFEAQDDVYSKLESYCHEFHCSSEFYSWLYGRYESDFSKTDETLTEASCAGMESLAGRKTVFELGSKLNKIKDVLTPNSVLEGQPYKSDEAETSMEMGEDVQMGLPNERNLHNWKVCIPTVGSRLDPITNKAYSVFVIQIQSQDNEEWVVERRPNDFYSLDVKLTEFHGTFADAQLPPKRLLTTRLESIQLYEEYLHKLIKNPVLKNSELLHTFLTSTDEFEEEENTFSKLFRKSVVPTLRKERGQNLEVFINSFVSSCRTTKYEWKDVGESKPLKKPSPSASDLYQNIFDISPDISQRVFFNRIPPASNDAMLERPSTSILYLGVKIYSVREKVARLLLSLQSVFGSLLDQIIILFTGRFLNSVLKSSNVAYLINLTERTIFDNKERVEPAHVKTSLLELLNRSKNSWLYPLYLAIYEILQDSKMNKQLYYQLMDAVLGELFPELDSIHRV